MRLRLVTFVLAVAAIAVSVAALLTQDGSTASRATVVGVAQRCPPGRSFMGCATGAAPVPAPGTTPRLRLVSPLGCKLPDVSSWQGHPSWAVAKPYICGAIAKAGENLAQDADVSYNIGVLAALGLWHTTYWFVRPGNCSAEGLAYVHVLTALHYSTDKLAGPPVLDDEVPGTQGYVGCMADVLYGYFHVWSVIYTAPGTWPGGSADGLEAWPAAYGPSAPPCLPFTCSHYVAFQFAAPPWVYYYVPGLGNQDESVDYTFTSQRPFAGKPVPTPSQVKAWTSARNSSAGAFSARACDANLSRADCWQFAGRVLYFQTLIEHTQTPSQRVHCFGPKAQLTAPKCKIVRPYVARWSRLRDAAKAVHNTGRERRYAALVKANLY